MAALPFAAGPSAPAYFAPGPRADLGLRRTPRAVQRVRFRGVPVEPVPATVPDDGSEAAEPPVFTALEAMAVQIGRGDPLTFFRSKRRFARLGGMLFGWKPPQPLAHPRLEALRILVIALRRRGRQPQEAVEAALRAGVSEAQLTMLAAELRPGWILEAAS